MNGQQPQQDPPITYEDPQMYILWLRRQRLNYQQIEDLVRRRFGAGETPEQRAKREAEAKQRSGFAQAGGAIGGAVLAQEGLRGFPTISGLFGSGTGAGATTAATSAGAGTAGVGATGAGAVTLTGGGVATIPAGASVPAGYTAVGTSASGGTMVAPTSMAGASAGSGATTGAGAGSTAASYAIPALAAVVGINNMWETGLKDIVRGRGDRADWTNQAVNALPVLGLPGTGGVINLGLRLAGKRSVGQMMKSGKSGAQSIRDDFRGDLKEAGIADDNYHVTLADGTKFNIGLDGKTKYKNVGENIDGKTTRNAWDVDWSNPLGKFATDKIEPMIRNIYGADDKKAGYTPGQFTGILVNAATSNAKTEQDVIANIEAMLGKSKFAQQAGVGITPPPPTRAPKGQVLRVSPGMYVNDKGHVGPAKTVGEALKANYQNVKKGK